MSDDLVTLLGRLALMAETANHWTDEHRLMPAAGVADIVYEAKDRIEELEAKLAKAVEFIEIVEKCGNGPLWDFARTTLAELKGEK